MQPHLQRSSRSDTSIGRRRFLIGCAAGGSYYGVHCSSVAARSHAAAEKLQVAVIGVGNRGIDNIAGVMHEDIVAICDVDAKYLERAAAQLPRAARYRDFRELIARQSLDAVVVSTPDHTHAVAAVTAMRRGLHVYCERPLAHNIGELRRMIDVARVQQAATQMGNQHHAEDGYRRAVQILQSGVLGPIRQAHAWTNRPLWPQGVQRPQDTPAVPKHLDWDLWLGPAPARPYHGAYHPVSWRGWWDFGCGSLGIFGPHILDPVFEGLRLGDCLRPREGEARPIVVTPDSSPVNDETAPQWSIIKYQYPARPEQPPVTLTWYDGGKLPPPEVTKVRQLPANGALLIGERAKLFIPALGRRPLVIPHDPKDRVELPEPMREPSPGHWREWTTACRGGTPASSRFEYSGGLTEVCLLGNVALRAGRRIEWNSPAMQIHSDNPDAKAYLSRRPRKGWEL